MVPSIYSLTDLMVYMVTVICVPQRMSSSDWMIDLSTDVITPQSNNDAQQQDKKLFIAPLVTLIFSTFALR